MANRNSRENPALLEYVLPEDVPQADEDFIEFYSQFNLMLAPIAFTMSYHRNKSLKWAAIHAILAAPYVAYVLVDAFAKEEARGLIRAHKAITKKADEKADQAFAWAEEWTGLK